MYTLQFSQSMRSSAHFFNRFDQTTAPFNRFNTDRPDDVFGGGDIETVGHILSHFKTGSICEGAEPNGVHCETVGGVDWRKAGQTLKVK